MRNILITGGGTGTAWHLCEIARQYYAGKMKIVLCDMSSPDLVPASKLADRTYSVPASDSDEYDDAIKEIIVKEHIDCLIPLIPIEMLRWYQGCDYLTEHGIETLAPTLKTALTLIDKKNLYEFLTKQRINTPHVFAHQECKDECRYIIKPRWGYGSLGIRVITGKDLKKIRQDSDFEEDYIIQEYCSADDYEEVTCEVFNGKNKLRTFVRKRISTKSGVCVKMEPVKGSFFDDTVERIISDIKCPITFNLQFLKDNGVWKLFDCNLRFAAGSAMSTAVGFQLTRAVLASILGEEVPDDLFRVNPEVRKVLRVYREITIP